MARSRTLMLALLAWSLQLLCPCAQATAPGTVDPALDRLIATYRAEGARQALPGFEQLLVEFRENGDTYNAARAERYVGECNWRLGNYPEARTQLEHALMMMRQLDDRQGEGRTLNVLGLLEWDLGRYEQAMQNFKAASQIGSEVNDRRLAGATMNNLGLVLDELGDYKASLSNYRQALELYEGTDFQRGESDTLGNIGGVHLLLGRFQEALAYYERALAISEALGAKPSMSLDHGNLALCYLGLGLAEDALRHFDLALNLAEAAGMSKEVALWQRGKGDAFIRKGQYDRGLEYHRLALATYEQADARGLLADSLHDMGRLHLDLGDPVSAEQYFLRANDMAQAIGQEQTVSATLISLGDLQFRRENFEQASELYREALQRTSAAGEAAHQALSHLRLAEVQRGTEQFDRAESEAREALAIAQRLGADYLSAEAWYGIGEAQRGRHESNAALASYRQAGMVLGQMGDPGLLWKIHHGRARSLTRLGDRQAAVTELQAAIRIIEGVRERVREERFKAGYLQDKYQVYVDLVRLQLELGQTSQAFSSAERLRARSFFDQLDRTGRSEVDEPSRQRATALREQVRRLQTALEQERQLGPTDRRQMAIDSFSSELLLAEREYQALLDDARRLPGRDRATGLPSLSEVQTQLRSGEALVEYVVDRDRVMIFLMRPGRLEAAVQPIPYRDLAAKVGLVRELLQSPQDDAWWHPAASLAQALIEPLKARRLLEGIEQLYIVPHGILNYLPFAVLPLGDAVDAPVMMERYRLNYLPAAALLVRGPVRRDHPSSLLAVAPDVSQLKHALTEARSIAALFEPHSRLLTGAAASESTFKSQAHGYSILHLSTHGYFNPRNPLFSGLMLEADGLDDGRLEVHEILNLPLSASLVTLSACDSGLGSGYFNPLPAGDAFVSLTRAFLLAGSRSVLATLWEVDDRATVQLMQGFYRGMESAGRAADPAHSLVDAQRRLRRSSEFHHPFYWAPFVLVGQQDPPPGTRI